MPSRKLLLLLALVVAFCVITAVAYARSSWSKTPTETARSSWSVPTVLSAKAWG